MRVAGGAARERLPFAPARQPHLDAGAASRIGLNGEARADRTHALLDDHRAFARDVELRLLEASREPEPAAVVVDVEPPVIAVRARADDDVSRAAVLPHVDERFAHDPNQLFA